MLETPPFRIAMAGTGALLFDAGGAVFSEAVQDRIHGLARALEKIAGVREAVPGMNNLLVTFDPLGPAEPEAIEDALLELWATVEPDPLSGEEIAVPVRYGGPDGPDLAEHAAHAGLSVEELVSRHSNTVYRVAAVGAMPGFVYLSGLDPQLARPRRATPRANVPEGAVVIGGAQAGIMPCTAPSGWHILGMTDFVLFDAFRPARPASFAPGDRIRFVPESISA